MSLKLAKHRVELDSVYNHRIVKGRVGYDITINQLA